MQLKKKNQGKWLLQNQDGVMNQVQLLKRLSMIIYFINIMIWIHTKKKNKQKNIISYDYC